TLYDLEENDLRFMKDSHFPTESFEEKPSIFSNNLHNIIEMFYWFVKFIGDYEKENRRETGLVGRNARYIIKLGRYLLKYIKSYEKI
ncbi:Uncharacterized protein FKW44_022136, partial [Caligus rogercresseyi]